MDEDCGANALEVLDEFLEANPDSLIPHLRPMLELCLQVAGDESRGDAVRVRALATVTFLAQKRPRALLRGGLLALVLRGLLVPLCAELRPENPDPEENWDEAGGGEGPCPRHAAAQALDALAQGLPPEKLLKELVSSGGGEFGEFLGIGRFLGIFWEFWMDFWRIFGGDLGVFLVTFQDLWWRLCGSWREF
ncbi:PREDICTED: importin-4-like [Corvus brachyrhynchos]|uniref:importin-4-like n=1 Tax=Corvus brachyrhynchos TaxID=85066 RepID=UPI000816788E|nr:PREDICTED: importin-4-like [Corvus brachyrhynchos]